MPPAMKNGTPPAALIAALARLLRAIELAERAGKAVELPPGRRERVAELERRAAEGVRT